MRSSALQSSVMDSHSGGKEHVSVSEFEGKEILKVSKEALTLLAQQAFHDCEFMLRRAHNKQVAAILDDPEASENDKYVALQFLRNAEVAVKGVLPFCQDTGTAIIHGEKGQQVWTGFDDAVGRIQHLYARQSALLTECATQHV